MPGFWRQCRIAFRCVRLAVWLLVLTALGVLLWCNRVGLPDFLKTRLVGTLHERGVELEFSRMRLSFTRGIVADDVQIGAGQAAAGATLAAREVRLQLDLPALWHRRWQLDGVVLRDGHFSLPLSPTNALTLDHLQTQLQFGADDTWSLDHFLADFAGAQIRINGELAHAPEVRYWKLFNGGGTNRGGLAVSLKDFFDTLQRIHFEGEPQLQLTLAGDARDVHSVTAQLEASALGVATPWFTARDFQTSVLLAAPADAPTNSDASWNFWTNLQPFRLVWSARLGELRSEKLDADAIVCDGAWAAPMLAVTNFSARIAGGQLDVSTLLDVSTRQLAFTNNSTFDPHAVAALLTEKARERLAEISWQQPPWLRVEGSLRLPPWEKSGDDWQNDIEPSVQVRGELAFTNVVVNGVAVDRVRTHFRYANLVWDLPDLTLAQERTQLRLNGEENEATKNFRCSIAGQVDAASVRPFLTTSNTIHGFAHLTTTEPLALALEVTGNLRALDNLAATGRVALTNFAVRGQTVDSVMSRLDYTNGVLQFSRPEMHRAQGAQMMTAEAVVLDFHSLMVRFINGFSTVEPAVLVQAIGPKTAHMLEPYHFLKPPAARVNGCLPLRDMNGPEETVGADLRFDIVENVPFQWLKLNTSGVKGTIHWLGPELVLTNLQAEFYGGTGEGDAYFDFRPAHEGADYRFNMRVTNVNLHQFATDMTSPTNRLEGTVSGWLAVTSADTRNLESWNGFGSIKLRDGLLWDIPVFSILSPVLNTVYDGLGNSRATEATADYTITNGVIYSKSVEIRARMMQLIYTGTVDMQRNVNARVTAQPLRNMWVVGPVVSTLLLPVSKIFEYQVTGKLDDPQATPIYFFTKILVAPLHPIRSLEQFFFPSTKTNAPAAK